jgi:hypothetical protein
MAIVTMFLFCPDDGNNLNYCSAMFSYGIRKVATTASSSSGNEFLNSYDALLDCPKHAPSGEQPRFLHNTVFKGRVPGNCHAKEERVHRNVHPVRLRKSSATSSRSGFKEPCRMMNAVRWD